MIFAPADLQPYLVRHPFEGIDLSGVVPDEELSPPVIMVGDSRVRGVVCQSVARVDQYVSPALEEPADPSVALGHIAIGHRGPPVVKVTNGSREGSPEIRLPSIISHSGIPVTRGSQWPPVPPPNSRACRCGWLRRIRTRRSVSPSKLA